MEEISKLFRFEPVVTKLLFYEAYGVIHRGMADIILAAGKHINNRASTRLRELIQEWTRNRKLNVDNSYSSFSLNTTQWQ